MHAIRGVGGVVLLCVCLIPALVFSQNLVWHDTVVMADLKKLFLKGTSLVKFSLNQDLEYSLTCSNQMLINRSQQPNLCQLSLLQHARLQSTLNGSTRLRIISSFVHDLGYETLFDSISRFQPDENTLTTRAEVKITRNFLFSVFSQVTTRLFNSYIYSTGQTGKVARSLTGSFCTPMVWTFSAGFGWTVPDFFTLGFGLSSGKFTYVRNKAIFDQPGVPSFYGVPKNKNHTIEYGLSLHMLIDHEFKKRVHWNCDMLVFKNYLKPTDLVMTNLVGIRIGKFITTSFRSNVTYESAVTRKVQIENIISLGLSFHL
ncbi:MAG: hypothetical protein WCK34_04585 [Bacteroidota bacterium]